MAKAIRTRDQKQATSRAAHARDEAVHRSRQIQRAAALLKQVSDPTRLQVITMLARGERHVGSLCKELSLSQAAVSHHLALLRHGGIITPRRQGQNNFYRLTDAGARLSQVVASISG
jgi:ArsR family transcriptional regulator, zinc-responsive transcriptional repressor